MARIVIIEDDELVRMTIRHALEKSGHQVVEAVDGEDGVLKVRQSDPEIVITDIIMPKQEGIETIIGLRKEWHDLKIIAISGGGRTGNMTFLEIASKLGADGMLKKPFTPEQLIATVQAVLAAA